MALKQLLVDGSGKSLGAVTDNGHVFYSEPGIKDMLTYPRGYVVPFELIDQAAISSGTVIHVYDDASGLTYHTDTENFYDFGLDWNGAKDLMVFLAFDYWFGGEEGKVESR
jgi:hypothetical protein